MTGVANRAPDAPFLRFRLRYGLEPGPDELQIQDFESVLGFRVSFEIVTGPISVRAIGHIWYT